MSLFFRIQQHLLPRAHAWRIVATKRLRSLFEGLSEWPADFRSFVDLIWEDLKPETTRELAAWEEQFGIYPSTVEANRRAAVDAEWLANGGQGLDYIQGVIQKVDPTVYVYGPWVSPDMELPGRRPKVWVRSDDVNATIDGSNRYLTIPNRGTLGGSATPATGSGPVRGEVDGKFAAETTLQGGLQLGTTASLQELHEPAGNATFFLAISTNAPAGSARLFSTATSGGSGKGLFLETTGGQLHLTIGNGTSTCVNLTGGALTAGAHVVAVVKAGPAVEMFLDGVSVASGTAVGLASGTHQTTPHVGSTLADGTKLNGAILEVLVFAEAFAVSKRAQYQELLKRWLGWTGFVPRDPRPYINQPLVGTVQCCEGLAQCGEDAAQANAFLANETHFLVNKDLQQHAPPAVPSDPATWPFFLYLAGPGGPDDVFFLDESKRRELERQILKIRPLENWVVMRDVGTDHLITDDGGFLSVDASGFLETT